MYVIVLASACRQLGFGLSHICDCIVMIEGLQIISFLVFQLLTIPLQVDPLSPTPFQVSHTALNILLLTIIYHFYIVLFSALELITVLMLHVILKE